MNAQTEILLIITVVSVACSIPGVFLVLRRMSMTADAITHTVLLGIVVGIIVPYLPLCRRCIGRHYLPASLFPRRYLNHPLR